MAFKAKRKQYKQQQYSLFKHKVTIPAKRRKQLPLDGESSYNRPRGHCILDEPEASSSGHATYNLDSSTSGSSSTLDPMSIIMEDHEESSTTTETFMPKLNKAKKKTQVSFVALHNIVSTPMLLRQGKQWKNSLNGYLRCFISFSLEKQQKRSELYVPVEQASFARCSATTASCTRPLAKIASFDDMQTTCFTGPRSA